MSAGNFTLKAIDYLTTFDPDDNASFHVIDLG